VLTPKERAASNGHPEREGSSMGVTGPTDVPDSPLPSEG
jgi:hypothetical protein